MPLLQGYVNWLGCIDELDSITQTSSDALRGFSTLLPDVSPTCSMITRVFAGQDEVAVAHFDQTDAGGAISPVLKSTAKLGPQTDLTVETEIWLENGVSLRTYLLDFNVVQVPEPSTAALLLTGLGSCLAVIRVFGKPCRK